MWTLVFLVFIGGELESKVLDTYESMYDCFNNREALSFEVGGQDGYFPPNSQAICIYRDSGSV